MRRFKSQLKNGRIYIMRLDKEGRLFGPEWEVIASFCRSSSNKERSKTIVDLLNKCDDNDRTRD